MDSAAVPPAVANNRPIQASWSSAAFHADFDAFVLADLDASTSQGRHGSSGRPVCGDVGCPASQPTVLTSRSVNAKAVAKARVMVVDKCWWMV
jgi:hypothetical protein